MSEDRPATYRSNAVSPAHGGQAGPPGPSGKAAAPTPGRGRAAWRWGLVVGLALVALLAAGRLVVRPSPPAAEVVVEGTASPGRPAPRIELPDFQGRRPPPGRLPRPVVINFWASWCLPCVAEMPAFEQAHRRLGDRIAFLGINQRDDRDAAQELARRTGVTYPLGVDTAGRSFGAFGGLGMPTTVLIRADGTVADVVAGQLDAELLARRIQDRLGVAA